MIRLDAPAAQAFVRAPPRAAIAGERRAFRSVRVPNHIRLRQAELLVAPACDAAEHDAERFAAGVGRGHGYTARPTTGTRARSAVAAPPIVHEVLRSPGRPLDPTSRAFFEPRLARDLSGVRVHDGAAPAASAEAVGAEAYTVGRHIVFGRSRPAPATPSGRSLLAHELAHVAQNEAGGGARVLRRKVLFPLPSTGSAPRWQELTVAERRQFLNDQFRRSPQLPLARRILEDMAAAADDLYFGSPDELRIELVKRITTSEVIQESQERVPPGNRTAFGYPFSGASILYGPRVNYAARDSWEPAPPDNYARRTDQARNRTLVALPRNRRHTVYGDPVPGSYSWTLTATGRADPHTAILNLFVPQQAHRRTLIHCDYLVSLVHFRSFAAAVGSTVFNQRVTTFGADRIRLRWNAFTDLETTPLLAGPTRPLGSLQIVNPTDPADLIIGDHVYFWNHYAYDLINKRIGNAWRLENAVLIDRRRGVDIFLGHGSGQKTAAQMRAKLAEEYNDVVAIARGLIRRSRSSNAAVRSRAIADLAARFPNLTNVGGRWHIRGTGIGGRAVDEEIRPITAAEVFGLTDPWNMARLYKVRRPIESA